MSIHYLDAANWGPFAMQSVTALTYKAVAIIAAHTTTADVLLGPHSSETHGLWCAVRDMMQDWGRATRPQDHAVLVEDVGFETAPQGGEA